MKQFFDVCHGVEYGNEGKKRWTKLGSLMVNEEGKKSLIFDYAPPTGEWLAAFPRDNEKKEPDNGTGGDLPF